MTNLNTFRVTTTCAFVADPSEAAESFVMENHDFCVRLSNGFIADPSDVDYVLQISWEKASRPSFKGGYRSFRKAFYADLSKWYDLVSTGGGLIHKHWLN